MLADPQSLVDQSVFPTANPTAQVALPAELEAAVGQITERVPTSQLSLRSRSLSADYRANTTRPHSMDPLAYAVHRMPGTFAATVHALQQLRFAWPDFEPRTLLDVACGPGTATWAASSYFPSIGEVSGVDADPAVLAVARSLTSNLRPRIQFRVGDVTKEEVESVDLAVCTYALAELGNRRAYLVGQLLNRARAVVLVEAGTPVGAGVIRDIAISTNNHALAPLSNDFDYGAIEYLHFSQRLQRPEYLRSAKHATRGYEDEKFAYLVAARSHRVSLGGRVISTPQVRKGHTILTIAAHDGPKTVVISRRHRDAYLLLRRARWGMSLSPDDARIVMSAAKPAS